MMQALIIDDESHARQTIKSILQASNSNITISGEAGTVKDAVTLIRSKHPQLIFLDIDLPDGNGFDILSQVPYKEFNTIFITAYQEYALQAIKFSAFDYIMKPINPSELIKAVENCLSENSSSNNEKKYEAFFSNFSNKAEGSKRIVLKTFDKIHVVEVKNIIRCESDNTYCTVFMEAGSSILVSKNIKSFDQLLHDFGFLRVHQSHLINTSFINYYDKQDGGSLVMSDDSVVPVSHMKKQVLLQYLDSL